ncbi:MAG: hypothetical protein AAEJ53_16410, partial [Myxococcota bacterium]
MAGSDYDILVARSMNDGLAWTAPEVLNGSGIGDTDTDSNPRLASDRKGGWLASWYKEGGATGIDGDIFAAFSADAGQSWTAPDLLNDNGAGDSGSDKPPSVATDRAGRWVAAWQSDEDLDGSADTDDDIFFATSDDIDGDGLSDAAEAVAGTDPLNPDSDFDGLSDGAESDTGNYVSPTDTGTNPLNPDTDSDGYGDGEEVDAGSDPTDGSVPAPVAQALAVYPSPGDDGLPGEAIDVRGTALVPVYFNNGLGSSPLAKQCTDFGGNEVCGWVLQLETTGDLLISGIDWEGTVSVVGDPTTLLVAASNPDVGGWQGATRIATVAVTGTLGELLLLAPGGGFVDRFGATLAFPDPEGVLLAKASPLPWAGLSVAEGRGCAVLANGSLHCWSATGVGGYGLPPTSGTYRKVVTGLTPPEYALELDGTVQQWGVGGAPLSGNYQDLVAGDLHRCGLRVDGEAECWDAPTGDPALGTPAKGPFRMLTRGGLHVCGLRTDGSVVCWGDNNDFGQVLPLPTGTFEALAGGTNHNCGIRPGDGSVDCWGDASDGKTAAQAGPFVAISAGSDHTCGIGDDGLVSCWGADALGQLAAPTDAFIALSATGSFTCGITDQA